MTSEEKIARIEAAITECSLFRPLFDLIIESLNDSQPVDRLSDVKELITDYLESGPVHDEVQSKF